MNIDQEWENFISSGKDDDISVSDNDAFEEDIENELEDPLDEIANIPLGNHSEEILDEGMVPKPTEIYISTKTKIAFLDSPIDLKAVFWEIPVIPYCRPMNGVVKKQMKFNSTTKEELEEIQQRVQLEPYFEEHIITHIDNPSGRIKFKDIRKMSIGISKKDIMSYRCKKKSAFYNCFVIILRLKVHDLFKEFHVKVFNTGKLEIPGIQNDAVFYLILEDVKRTLQPFFALPLNYIKPESNETVLINSNFNCGFYINREALYDALKFKYNIQCIYDPCSYPGIQCKFYFNPDAGDIQNGCQIQEENKHLYKNVREISFMIFRTGSVLIVGKCDENVLIIIYEYLKVILTNEYRMICQKGCVGSEPFAFKDKSKKARRKSVMVEFNSLASV